PVAPRYLHSFPTRRSSDLPRAPADAPRLKNACLRAKVPAAVEKLRSYRFPTVLENVVRAYDRPDAIPDCARHALPSQRQTHRILDRKSTRLNSSHVKISYA